jgi:hypothetical protein
MTKTPGFSRVNRPRRTALCNRLLANSELEAGNLLGVRKGECELRAVVEAGQKARHLPPHGLARGIMLRACPIAHETS